MVPYRLDTGAARSILPRPFLQELLIGESEIKNRQLPDLTVAMAAKAAKNRQGAGAQVKENTTEKVGIKEFRESSARKVQTMQSQVSNRIEGKEKIEGGVESKISGREIGEHHLKEDELD